MTLDDLIEVQKQAGLGNVHLAWIGPHGFCIAHTDYERDMKIPLRMCHLHQWLEDRAGPPAPEGVYVVNNHDVDGWQFHPLTNLPITAAMDIPNRDANSTDPIVYPYRDQGRSADNSAFEAQWLKWRLTDPDLASDLRSIMEVEAIEVTYLSELLQALDDAQGATLEQKLANPVQRDHLRSLSLRWLRAQRALLDATTAELDHKAGGNGQ